MKICLVNMVEVKCCTTTSKPLLGTLVATFSPTLSHVTVSAASSFSYMLLNGAESTHASDWFIFLLFQVCWGAST